MTCFHFWGNSFSFWPKYFVKTQSRPARCFKYLLGCLNLYLLQGEKIIFLLSSRCIFRSIIFELLISMWVGQGGHHLCSQITTIGRGHLKSLEDPGKSDNLHTCPPQPRGAPCWTFPPKPPESHPQGQGRWDEDWHPGDDLSKHIYFQSGKSPDKTNGSP